MADLAPDAILGFGHYIGFASLIARDPEHAEHELKSLGARLEELGERAIASTWCPSARGRSSSFRGARRRNTGRGSASPGRMPTT